MAHAIDISEIRQMFRGKLQDASWNWQKPTSVMVGLKRGQAQEAGFFYACSHHSKSKPNTKTRCRN